MATLVNEAEAQRTARTAAGTAERGMDLGTLIGTVGGSALIVLAILLGGSASTFADLPAFLIVFGGTTTTTFMAYPSSHILTMIPVIFNAFKPEVRRPADFVDEIITLANRYRNEGMKRLEQEEKTLTNRFMKTGITLIVDGYNSREIHEIMERELTAMVERHNAGQKILRFMAAQAPVFGLAGTVLGLIQMLLHLDDPSRIGPSMGTAMIATFYGLILNNLIITPIVAKLTSRTEDEATLLKAVRVGIMGIYDRVNPTKIQRSMNSILPPSQQR
jgi:chemotaxis protein MotA